MKSLIAFCLLLCVAALYSQPTIVCGPNQEFVCPPIFPFFFITKDCGNRILWPLINNPPNNTCLFRNCVCVKGYVARSLFNRTCIKPDQCP